MDEFEKGLEFSCATWPNVIIVRESEAAIDIEMPPMRGPFSAAPEGEVLNAIEWDVFFPSAPLFPKPSAKIMLHPIMRNVYHIRNVEEATGLTAIARRGYVELVKL